MQGAQEDGRRRVVIEAVTPQIDCGRFAVKRTLGERVEVEADAFTDGHDLVTCVLLWRDAAEDQWREAAMQPLGNDRWRGDVLIERLGSYRYTVNAWIDHFASWRRELARRIDPADVASALQAGAELIERAATRAAHHDGATLRTWAQRLCTDAALEVRVHSALSEDLAALMTRHADRSHATRFARELVVVAERERARSSLRQRASRVAPRAARRQSAIRREPAEEIRGHLSLQFRERSVAGAVGRTQRRGDVLGRPRRAHLPRRQSSHETVRTVGMDHQ